MVRHLVSDAFDHTEDSYIEFIRCKKFALDNLHHPLLLLLLLKKIGNARLGEGDCHPISQKTPAPHYQPIEEKKRKGK